MVGGSENDRCRRAREWSSLRLDGELSELERLLLRRHLGRCAECRTFAEAIQGSTRVVRTTPLEQPERPLAAETSIAPRSRRRVRLIAATALVVVAAGVGAVVGAVIGSAGEKPAAPQQFPSIALIPPSTTPTPPTTGNI